MKCDRGAAGSSSPPISRSPSLDPTFSPMSPPILASMSSADEMAIPTAQAPTIPMSPMSSDHLVRRVNSGSFPLEMSQMGSDLQRGEKFKILSNRGRTRALSFALAALWEIDPKRLEIGVTTLGKKGARTHIVHYLYGAHGDALLRVQKMYSASAEEVSQVFREHFGLGADFSVHFEAARYDGSVAPNHTTQFERALSSYIEFDDETEFGALKEKVMHLLEKTQSQYALSAVDGVDAVNEGADAKDAAETGRAGGRNDEVELAEIADGASERLVPRG